MAAPSFLLVLDELAHRVARLDYADVLAISQHDDTARARCHPAVRAAMQLRIKARNLSRIYDDLATVNLVQHDKL